MTRHHKLHKKTATLVDRRFEFFAEKLNSLRRDILHEVNDAVAITPFIVIPAHDLEEAFFALQIVLQRRETVVNGAAVVVDEVGGNEFLVGHTENALEIVLAGFL